MRLWSRTMASRGTGYRLPRKARRYLLAPPLSTSDSSAPGSSSATDSFSSVFVHRGIVSRTANCIVSAVFIAAVRNHVVISVELRFVQIVLRTRIDFGRRASGVGRAFKGTRARACVCVCVRRGPRLYRCLCLARTCACACAYLWSAPFSK